jgi:hypothetical protein
MFTKTFFKFLAGFLAITAFGVFGAIMSNWYFDSGDQMFANTEEGYGKSYPQ